MEFLPSQNSSMVNIMYACIGFCSLRNKIDVIYQHEVHDARLSYTSIYSLVLIVLFYFPRQFVQNSATFIDHNFECAK